MTGMWPVIRRIGRDVRKFAEHNPKMDDILMFGTYATIFWSGIRLKKKNDAAAAAADASAAARAAAEAAYEAERKKYYKIYEYKSV